MNFKNFYGFLKVLTFHYEAFVNLKIDIFHLCFMQRRYFLKRILNTLLKIRLEEL